MNAGHRCFVVEGDDVTRIAQTTFHAFYSQGEPVLPQYAGTTITVAFVTYAVKNRRPHHITSLNCTKMRVNADGSLDEDHALQSIQLALDRSPIGTPQVTPKGSVRDAEELFKERQYANLHPNLSGPAHKKILIALFGSALGR